MERSALHEAAIEQIKFARGYTQSLLADIAEEEWFVVPAGTATHIAWQVGHLAMAEYGLCMFRVRGRKPEDLELMPSKFRKQFSRGSIPDLDPANNPSPADLKRIFETIHAQAIEELSGFTAEQLAEPTDMPYMVSPTKLGGVLFCSHHEMIHAGQIGLIRRHLGKLPIR